MPIRGSLSAVGPKWEWGDILNVTPCLKVINPLNEYIYQLLSQSNDRLPRNVRKHFDQSDGRKEGGIQRSPSVTKCGVFQRVPKWMQIYRTAKFEVNWMSSLWGKCSFHYCPFIHFHASATPFIESRPFLFTGPLTQDAISFCLLGYTRGEYSGYTPRFNNVEGVRCPSVDRIVSPYLSTGCLSDQRYARVSLKISLKFVPKVRINNIPSLVQIMACRRPGDKPLSEPMMVS